MLILTKIISGYLTGLSVGVYCLGLCLPVFLPILLSQIGLSFRNLNFIPQKLPNPAKSNQLPNPNP